MRAAALMLGGCMGSIGVAVGPTLDTQGNVGIEGALRGTLGISEERTSRTVAAALRLGAGGMDVDGALAPYGLWGIEVAGLLPKKALQLRAGVSYAGRALSQRRSLHGLGASFGVSGALHQSSRGGRHLLHSSTRIHLGAELRFEQLWGAGLDRSVFSLPLTLDASTWIR